MFFPNKTNINTQIVQLTFHNRCKSLEKTFLSTKIKSAQERLASSAVLHHIECRIDASGHYLYQVNITRGPSTWAERSTGAMVKADSGNNGFRIVEE